jgi:hypothetical protein
MAYPNTIVLDCVQLAQTRARLISGEYAILKQPLNILERRAQKWLSQGPWSVTNKTDSPPSGDVHDYTSQAPYWWPSDTPDGRPYVRRDGVKNPEIHKYNNRRDVQNVFRATYDLSLAWFYTDNDAYARHSANILRTWFLSPTTRMNPNLNHAQIIPHANTGRCIGIIDFSQGYTSVLDAALILSGAASGRPAPGWTSKDVVEFRHWNMEFLEWLTNSEFGREESMQKNNHGVFACMQKSAIARFVGNDEQARQEIRVMQDRIDACIAPDGSQPEELKRTRSWHYSIFNLLALTRAAAIGNHIGLDLWSYQGPQGQSLMKAIEYLIPSATEASPWTYPEIDFQPSAAADVLRAAAAAGSGPAQRAVLELQVSLEDIWDLRPAPEQLDPVK